MLTIGLKQQGVPLTHLKLSSNQLTDEACEQLAGALEGVPPAGHSGGLTLDLSRNQCTGSGANMLISRLRGLLKELTMLGNTMGDDGVAQVAAALSPESMLKVLDLTGVGMTNDGLPALLAALDPIAIQALSRSHGSVPKEPAFTVTVGGNKIGSAGLQYIDDFENRHGTSAVDIARDRGGLEDESPADADVPPKPRPANAAEEAAAAAASTGTHMPGQTFTPAPSGEAKIENSSQWPSFPAPASSDQSSSSSGGDGAVGDGYKEGDCVEIVGLSKVAHYNGLQGIISSPPLNGRYSVWIISLRKSLAVKPDNLVPCQEKA